MQGNLLKFDKMELNYLWISQNFMDLINISPSLTCLSSLPLS